MHSDALTTTGSTKAGTKANGSSLHLNASTSALKTVVSKSNGDCHTATKNPAKNRLSASDKEIIRIVGQQLQEMGFSKASETLMNESGCKLEHSITTRLRDQILKGDWSEVVQTLEDMRQLVKHGRYIQKMLFLVLQQKYLELIEDNMFVDALLCLRNEIQPLNIYMSRVHQLPSFLMIKDRNELLKAANWSGKGQLSRTKLLDRLQNYLPMSVMMPPGRLRALLTQALRFQQAKCLFHNSDELPEIGSYSLLVDHACHRRNFPVVEKQVLNNHANEAWFCQFSNNGKMLATGSKDSMIILWDVDQVTHEVTLNRSFHCHTSGVGYMSWSPDDQYLIVCGTEDSNEVYLFDSQTGEMQAKMSHSPDDSLVCCCWAANDSTRFVVGGLKGQFYECDIDGNVLQTWEGVRVQALASRLPSPSSSQNSSHTYLAADTQYRVRSYNFEDETEENFIKEDSPIMSMTISSCGRYLLTSLVNQGINLWDLQDKVKLRKLQGCVQGGSFQIYSTFGGASEMYVASGSEDGKVYIWHRGHEKPIEVLSGHTKAVSCVSWNKAIPSMLASVSDDHSVRIWGPPESNHNSYEEDDDDDDDYTSDEDDASDDVTDNDDVTTRSNNNNNATE